MKKIVLLVSLLSSSLLWGCSQPNNFAEPNNFADETLEGEAFVGATLHLNPWGSNASDSNDGSASKPLKTIQAAFDKMLVLKESGQSVRILFYPGIYRDVLINGEAARTFWRIPDNNAQLVLQAKEKGTAIFSGSDVWTGWTNEGGGLWSKAWPYDWGAPGAGDDLTPGAPDVSELAARRELVFVGGERLAQVLTKPELRTGSFQVDEAANKLTLKLRAGLNPNSVTTEVATREQLFYVWNRSNITIRGMVFQHSADKFRGGAVSFQEGDGVNFPRNCRNIRVADTQIINNGQLGLDNYCENAVMRRNQVNDNGFGGIMGGSVKGWLLEDNQTNRNAWRSWAGGYKGWATAGVKVLDVEGFTVRRHQSIGNYADGFWVDTNVSSVILEDSTIAGNATNGIFLEASQGPMSVKNNLICGSGQSEILLSAVAKATLDNNRVLSDRPLDAVYPETSTVIFLSELRRDDTLFGFGQFPLRDITLRNNTFVATGQRSLTNGWVYYKPTDPADDQRQADYEAFVATLRSSNNTWYSPLAKPFTWVDTKNGYGEPYTFAAWKALTKQDGSSSFSNSNLTCPN
jgi:hypothetical protein